jgi:HD-GYP domain-containing protein (c-di-GMP phosphodiesterase class II)
MNSFHNQYFRDRILEQVEIFVHLLSEMIMRDLAATHALVAAMRTSISMVQTHDLETGTHLERMSRYSRLISRSLVKQGLEQLDDEQIEQIALFAPLHDIGKIGIPDRILQKPTHLSSEERKIMNTHTVLGRQIVDDLISNFGFEQIPYIDYLRHIAELHHEAMDGSGYPHGLRGQEISLEARIIAVSDIFDALTTQRPYKSPWSNEHAFAMLQLLSIDKLDKGCVSALDGSTDEIMQIQQQFAEMN